jgi:hypothetical protein
MRRGGRDAWREESLDHRQNTMRGVRTVAGLETWRERENADHLTRRGERGGPAAVMHVAWREESFTDGQSTTRDAATMAGLEK